MTRKHKSSYVCAENFETAVTVDLAAPFGCRLEIGRTRDSSGRPMLSVCAFAMNATGALIGQLHEEIPPSETPE